MWKIRPLSPIHVDVPLSPGSPQLEGNDGNHCRDENRTDHGFLFLNGDSFPGRLTVRQRPAVAHFEEIFRVFVRIP